MLCSDYRHHCHHYHYYYHYHYHHDNFININISYQYIYTLGTLQQLDSTCLHLQKMIEEQEKSARYLQEQLK